MVSLCDTNVHDSAGSTRVYPAQSARLQCRRCCGIADRQCAALEAGTLERKRGSKAHAAVAQKLRPEQLETQVWLLQASLAKAPSARRAPDFRRFTGMATGIAALNRRASIGAATQARTR